MSNNTAVVQIQNVEKRYGEHQVLKSVNFDIQAGEFVAFVGESGGGKSTLLRLIAGLESVSSGQLLMNGQALTGLNKSARVMFQDDRLLPWLTV